MVEHSEAVTPSVKKYRHDLTWQIIVPIIVVGLIIIAGAVFISLGKTGSISLWSDISLIWILLPALFMAFIVVIILVAAIYGMARLVKATPRFTSRAQELTWQAALGIQKVAGATAKPFFWLGQAGAAFRALFKHQGE